VGVIGGRGWIAKEVFDGLAGFGHFGAFGDVVVGGERVFLELAELGEEAQVLVAELALVAGEEEEIVAGGIVVEGGGEGLAGRFGKTIVIGDGVEVVEVALGVGHALELPEDLGDLRDQVSWRAERGRRSSWSSASKIS